ncbi:MAG: hypothetical protein WC967_06615 [Balneolaceae bacterium]
MPTDKLYSQKEIKALLQKATELQRNELGKNNKGLTLEELEQIAADSGINPMYIREAISGQSTSVEEKSSFHLLGAPLSLEIGKEVPFEMSIDDWELVVQEARRTFKRNGGTIQKLGKSLEWMSPENKFINTSLTATPLKKKTRFFVSSHFGKAAFFIYYFPFIFTLLTMFPITEAMGLSAAAALTLLFGSAVTVLAGSRYFFGKWVQSRKKKMENMITRFGEIISFDDKTAATQKVDIKSDIIIPDSTEEDALNESSNRDKVRN